MICGLLHPIGERPAVVVESSVLPTRLVWVLPLLLHQDLLVLHLLLHLLHHHGLLLQHGEQLNLVRGRSRHHPPIGHPRHRAIQRSRA